MGSGEKRVCMGTFDRIWACVGDWETAGGSEGLLWTGMSESRSNCLGIVGY